MCVTTGNATRVCYENGTWGDINVLSCQSLAIVRVVDEVKGYKARTTIPSLSYS